jgi:cell shape-determining protein MreC
MRPEMQFQENRNNKLQAENKRLEEELWCIEELNDANMDLEEYILIV